MNSLSKCIFGLMEWNPQKKIYLLIFCSLLVNTIGELKHAQANARHAVSKNTWSGKAARHLRYQKPISLQEYQQWQNFSKREIFEQITADPSFYLKLLQFSLFYTTGNELEVGVFPYLEGQLSPSATQHSMGLHGVLSSIAGGSLLDIFDEPDTIYIEGLTAPNRDEYYFRPFVASGFDKTALTKLDDDELVTYSLDFLEKHFEEPLLSDSIVDEITLDTFCEHVFFQKDKFIILGSSATESLFERIGIPYSLLDFISSDIIYDMYENCLSIDFSSAEYIRKRFLEHQHKTIQVFKKIINTPPYLEGKVDPSQSKQYGKLMEIIPVSLSSLLELNDRIFKSVENENSVFNLEFFFNNMNSSTNFNRRRAATVFERFLCEKLEPIDIFSDGGGAKGGHATDPACQSCHVKLDPMAGFFKDHGLVGIDFGISSGSNLFIFSDGLTLDNEQAVGNYLSSWKDDNGQWNIGYIRNHNAPYMNEYGQNLSDLKKILRRIPETKQCYTKRFVEFFLHPDLTYDSHWMKDVEERLFDSSAGAQSFKEALWTIVDSKAFSEAEPLSGNCYDLSSGSADPDAPPCEIRGILEDNCHGCHSGSSPASGLSLDRWGADDNGVEGFIHVDKKGDAESSCKTFNSMAARMRSTNPRVMMPPGGFGNNYEKLSAISWVRKQQEVCNK